ncbi:unnamed protein product [Linum trigynum]|uniref:CCHC-type domain-containing protein n=1 Tax=Linum trigynum TaxID=586398 RepID=A0AAV2CCA6_9ROSI
MAWGEGKKKMFSEAVKTTYWYVEDSDSEDIAEAMREDARDEALEEEDPLSPNIEFTAAELRAFRREWRSAIVVKVLGRSFPYPVIAKRLNMIWAKQGSIQITNRSKGFYFFRFTSKLDYEHALNGGPWMIGDHYLAVQKWKKSFNPNMEIKSTLVWLRLPDLPIEFFHPQAVMRIAERAGIPVRVDRATELGARGGLARACVEIDFTKPLLTKFKIEGIQYEIQYEGLANVCFECGRYGHSKGTCPTLHQTRAEEGSAAQTQELPKRSEPYGEWMIAKRRGRQPNNHNNAQAAKNHDQVRMEPTGSRFAVLSEEGVADSETADIAETSRGTTMNRDSTDGDITRTHKGAHQERQVWVEKQSAGSVGKDGQSRVMSSEKPVAAKPLNGKTQLVSEPKTTEAPRGEDSEPMIIENGGQTINHRESHVAEKEQPVNKANSATDITNLDSDTRLQEGNPLLSNTRVPAVPPIPSESGTGKELHPSLVSQVGGEVRETLLKEGETENQ